MATGGKVSDYQVLLEVQRELVDRIIRGGTDVEVLITRAVSKGLITLQGLEANAASTSLKRAEQFVARVLEVIRGDPSGERTTLFLQVLDDVSLSPLSEFVRSKLAETRGDIHHNPSPPAYRPRSPRQPPGGAYGGQPKLAPADEEDSGIVKEGIANNNNDNDMEVVMNTQHKMAPANTGGAGFTSLSNGVIAVSQEHSENLTVSSEDDPPAIPETQPHTPHVPASTSNPLITGVTSVPPVLEQTQTEQENQELRARVAKMANNEECLQNKLTQVQAEKEKSEQKLKEKNIELETVKREKNAQIESLKAQIKEKEEKMEELQHKLSCQEQQNEAMKEQHKVEIAKLKKKLEETEEKFHAEILKLTKETHQLELKVEKMHTREEHMKRQISEEKQRSAELKAEVAEEKHRQSVSENEQLKEELAKLKRRLNSEPDTS